MREHVTPDMAQMQSVYSLEVGKVYLVQMDDCCVVGDFYGRVVDLISDDGEVLFNNGVQLTTCYGVKFFEVEDHDANDFAW